MDFKDTIRQFADRIEKLRDNLPTEEATKNGLIMPFIAALGYDVFDPTEVLPEMTCDIVGKKGEKIDYAILRDGEPAILIECKHWKQNLSLHDNQLSRYFVTSKAKFGVLTNGIVYRFFTDLEAQNVMDEKPFLEVNILEATDHHIEELKKFHKSYFDVGNILSSASELKYMSELKTVIATEFASPSIDLVKLLGKQVYQGPITAKVADQLTILVKRAISSYINEQISNRFKAAISDSPQEPTQQQMQEEQEQQTPESKIETTEEELQAFYIVKSILRSVLEPARITYRDAQSYFAVFADNNNRKPICRLYLNSPTNKKVAFIDDNKAEQSFKIESIDDLYSYSEQFVEAANKYI